MDARFPTHSQTADVHPHCWSSALRRIRNQEDWEAICWVEERNLGSGRACERFHGWGGKKWRIERALEELGRRNLSSLVAHEIGVFCITCFSSFIECDCVTWTMYFVKPTASFPFCLGIILKKRSWWKIVKFHMEAGVVTGSKRSIPLTLCG